MQMQVDSAKFEPKRDSFAAIIACPSKLTHFYRYSKCTTLSYFSSKRSSLNGSNHEDCNGKNERVERGKFCSSRWWACEASQLNCKTFLIALKPLGTIEGHLNPSVLLKLLTVMFRGVCCDVQTLVPREASGEQETARRFCRNSAPQEVQILKRRQKTCSQAGQREFLHEILQLSERF